MSTSDIEEFPPNFCGPQLISPTPTLSEQGNLTNKSKLSIKHLVFHFMSYANYRRCRSHSTEPYQFQFPRSSRSNSRNSHKGKKGRCVPLCHEVRVRFSSDFVQWDVRPRKLSNLTIRDKKRHGLFRRIANPLFSQSFLRELEPTMLRYCQLFLNGIRDEAKENGGVINLTKWIDHLAFDVHTLL